MKVLGFEALKRVKNKLVYTLRIVFKTRSNVDTFTDKIRLRMKHSSHKVPGGAMANYADKHKVRDFVEKEIGESYLINEYAFVKTLTEDLWNSLPNQFVIKTNFGTGSKHYTIVDDKRRFNFKVQKEKFDKAIQDKWYLTTRELHYSNIEPGIVIEEYLKDESSKSTSPIDYKLYMFSGKCAAILECRNRGEKDSIKTFYDMEWSVINLNGSSYNSDEKLKTSKPEKLTELISASELLSKDFDHCRVDFYIISNKIYFGEITLTDAAGIADYSSLFNNYLGRLWNYDEKCIALR